ncbi:hypothetical protein GCM10010464_86330 [Pseudonocardia yunnanensis]
MDGIAERVRRRLNVPTALVSLLQGEQQVFPGLAGRATPLSHSLCQHVVATAEPLVITDARNHPPAPGDLAMSDPDVVAYAGVPVIDGVGQVLGSLCAIDTRPRNWAPAELETLEDLARVCSAELRLRLALVDAQRERRRRDELDEALRRSYDRSQALLTASQAFTETTTLAQAQARLDDVLSGDLAPTYIEITLLGRDGRLHRLVGPAHSPGPENSTGLLEYGVNAPMPTATAVRESRTMHYADRAQFDADHPVQSQNLLRALDLHTVVAVPLPGGQGPRGAIVLGWDRHRALDAMDLLAATTIAGYAAHAITRAELQQHRIDVVYRLQQAMLTELPPVHGLRMAAHYRPADFRDQVGGDWYDAVALPDPAHPAHPLLAVTVGDIIGHDVDAATIMGQTRSMIRQAGWDHPSASPTQTLEAFETANAGLQLGAAGSLVLAHLRPPGPGTGTWLMTWTNAGHPPPLVVRANGTTVLLDAHDALFGLAALRQSPRHDHYTDLEPGSTLFLYTDGLIERRGQDLDTGLENLRGLLTDHHEGSVQSLVETTVDALAPDATDDVIAFAIHIPTVT